MALLYVSEVAKKWGISERRIRKLCSSGMIKDAVKENGVWMISDCISKPSDRRYKLHKHIVIVSSSKSSALIISKHFELLGYKTSVITNEELAEDDKNVYKCNINDSEKLNELFKTFQRIDSLILFPSSYLPKTIDETTQEEFDYYSNLIVKHTYNCIKYSIEKIRQSKGNIILIHSSVAINAEPGALVYSMLSSTLIMLGKALAIKEGKYKVRVNNVALGPAATDKLKQQVARSQISHWKSINPLEVSFKFEDCLDALAFLAIPNNSSTKMTGCVLTVDGGESIADAYTVTQKGDL